MHGACGERASARPVGGDPVIKPPSRHRSVHKPTLHCTVVEPGPLPHRSGIPDHHPGRHTGIAFAVVLPQSAAGSLAIHRRGLSLGRGVVVVVDAPSRQPGNRQHR